jgi:hypothetical protein
MSDSIGGHEMINHLGQVIRVTARTLRTLDMQHFLQRDRASGLLAMKPWLFPLWAEFGPDYELGPDMSGANQCICKCAECQSMVSDLDYTRLSTEHHRVKVNEALNAVRSKRRKAA